MYNVLLLSSIKMCGVFILMGKGEYCICGCRFDYHRSYFDDDHKFQLAECEECECKQFVGRDEE